jgi:hypothetical protein
VTSDGTSESEIIGIISEHELRLITLGTCKTDKKAQTHLNSKLGKSNKLIVKLYENIPIAHILSNCGESQYSHYKRAIELSVLKWKRSLLSTWLNIGVREEKNNYY